MARYCGKQNFRASPLLTRYNVTEINCWRQIFLLGFVEVSTAEMGYT